MLAMAIDRRDFLIGASASFTAALTSTTHAMDAPELFAAARREADGTFAAAIFDLRNGDVAQVPLPDRGHDAVWRPGMTSRTSECVVFARRPGNFAVAFSANNALSPRWFSTPATRHFYGHGVFSNDGKLLYTTENDISSGAGMIGIRDATNSYQQLGVFPSFGIGPHDITLMPDGKTLIVANGGIETHPDTGRTPLNLAAMKPSLTYIDRETGDLIDQQVLSKDLHQLSIRHLAVTQNGTVVFGCQHKGSKSERPSLVGLHEQDHSIALVEMPPATSRDMRSYIGSIDVDRDGTHAVATSPRGGLALVIDIEKATIIDRLTVSDVSGVCPTQRSGEFLLTDGHGSVHAWDVGAASTRTVHRVTGVNWDNHAAARAL